MFGRILTVWASVHSLWFNYSLTLLVLTVCPLATWFPFWETTSFSALQLPLIALPWIGLTSAQALFLGNLMEIQGL